MVEITCECGCGRKRMVREADRKRGWGKFFDKSCKAKWQERKTGAHRSHLNRQRVATDRRNYGGTPQYNSRGAYVGFTLEPGEEF